MPPRMHARPTVIGRRAWKWYRSLQRMGREDVTGHCLNAGSWSELIRKWKVLQEEQRRRMTRALFGSGYANDLTWVWTPGCRVILGDYFRSVPDWRSRVETHKGHIENIRICIYKRHNVVPRITRAYKSKTKMYYRQWFLGVNTSESLMSRDDILSSNGTRISICTRAHSHVHMHSQRINKLTPFTIQSCRSVILPVAAVASP